ncbi:DUF262 domain-containing protein [Grimontia sp. AD028]|uniref:DUF262 domain-containing protein n=1 Tax=Grimontia sp. AD028 TaxID=1581149 RepID=UPI000697A0B8|nr:DUF262 domain-containing protein [Grimontia sp. AD028]
MNYNNQPYINQQQIEDIFKKHLKTSEYSLSIRTLFGQRMARKINYHPYYQRNYVWDNSKASFFIESILLGTDIPPIILFNTGDTIEVIDGRQRFETIKRFRDNELKLSIKGLNKLTQFKGYTFSKLDNDIVSILDNTKIRVFEFEVINEPRLDSNLEDKIKKEIFRRYNSGITPLNAAEIDNAIYDDDQITNHFKNLISADENILTKINNLFIGGKNGTSTAKALEFLRKYLILSSFPIKTYANGSNRTEIIDLLYNVRSDNTEDVELVCETMLKNIYDSELYIKNIESEKLRQNRYFSECILWAIGILRDHKIDDDDIICLERIKRIQQQCIRKESMFSDGNAHYYTNIIERFKTIADIFEGEFEVNFSKFIKNDNFRNEVKGMRQSEREAKLKLEELSSLRLHRPDASMLPVEEIALDLNSRNYMLRPSYQRQEKINVVKASAIIESIILGIKLPPIFVYINENNVKEIIDGQQRLLSIIGFMGEPYTDEDGSKRYANLNNFPLKRLKILKELNGSKYSELPNSIQDKILEFKLGVIEIESAFNEAFDPVDLFVRLNNKPYPIKENSFEMWNSFIEKDAIENIKSLTKSVSEWFFVKNMETKGTTDRMQNEELITMLAYISYNNSERKNYKSVGFFLRAGRINCRISDKKDISSLLEKISTDVELKKIFIHHIEMTANRISELESILKKEHGEKDLKNALNDLFNFADFRANNKRTLADFFILFEIISFNVNFRILEFADVKNKIREIQELLLTPPDLGEEGDYYAYFKERFSEKI